ncbi:MAG: hypothetical protein HC941_05140 [Microcoleus sp. SU_5_3]|nr:hypothetical protein [Microcoleus sp. SU_5_3]
MFVVVDVAFAICSRIGSVTASFSSPPYAHPSYTSSMVNNGHHVVIADKDADIILPPSSAVNPIPALPVAVRVDNAEQLMHLLTTDPSSSNHAVGTTSSISSSFKQYLVFGTDACARSCYVKY